MLKALSIVWRSAETGYLDTFRHFLFFLRLTWKPYFLTFAGVSIIALLEGAAKHDDIRIPLVWGSIQMLFATAMTGLFSLAYYRYRLLGWGEETKKVKLKISNREVRFFALLLLYVAPWLVAWIVCNLASKNGFAGWGPDVWQAMMFAMNALAALIFTRAALIGPMIALDAEHPFRRGWKLAKGYWLRLILLSVLAYAPIMLFNHGLTSFVGEWSVFPIISVSTTFLFFLGNAIGVAAIARFYSMRMLLA